MGFLGMRSTADWVTNQRPENWRETILMLYPNGQMPLTGILSLAKPEVTNDPVFHWWTEELTTQSGAVTGIYTDALSTAYVSGGVAGDYLYFKMAEATVEMIREGHQVLLRDASDLTVDVNGLVVDRVANGANSYVKVKLLEDDDNSSSGDLSNCDRIMVIGNANSEGSAMPDAVSTDPVEWYNYTQIFRTPLEITGTAIETKLRTNPQAYQKLKMQTLERHGIEMEKAWLWGVSSSGTGDNRKPLRTTLGLIPAIKGGYTGSGGTAGTTSDYPTATAYSGKPWLQGGEDWLDTQLEVMFRYGSNEKLAVCGSGALMAINKIIKNGGDYSFEPSTNAYGINVSKWVTPVGTVNFMTHPLMSQETTTRNSMVIFEPANVKYRPLTNRDTKFFEDDSSGYTRRDGKKEEFLTEAGLEYHHPVGWGYLTGLGTDNSL
jgi:hypothetical protein